MEPTNIPPNYVLANQNETIVSPQEHAKTPVSSEAKIDLSPNLLREKFTEQVTLFLKTIKDTRMTFPVGEESFTLAAEEVFSALKEETNGEYFIDLLPFLLSQEQSRFSTTNEKPMQIQEILFLIPQDQQLQECFLDKIVNKFIKPRKIDYKLWKNHIEKEFQNIKLPENFSNTDLVKFILRKQLFPEESSFIHGQYQTTLLIRECIFTIKEHHTRFPIQHIRIANGSLEQNEPVFADWCKENLSIDVEQPANSNDFFFAGTLMTIAGIRCKETHLFQEIKEPVVSILHDEQQRNSYLDAQKKITDSLYDLSSKSRGELVAWNLCFLLEERLEEKEEIFQKIFSLWESPSSKEVGFLHTLQQCQAGGQLEKQELLPIIRLLSFLSVAQEKGRYIGKIIEHDGSLMIRLQIGIPNQAPAFLWVPFPTKESFSSLELLSKEKWNSLNPLISHFLSDTSLEEIQQLCASPAQILVDVQQERHKFFVEELIQKVDEISTNSKEFLSQIEDVKKNIHKVFPDAELASCKTKNDLFVELIALFLQEKSPFLQKQGQTLFKKTELSKQQSLQLIEKIRGCVFPIALEIYVNIQQLGTEDHLQAGKKILKTAQQNQVEYSSHLLQLAELLGPLPTKKQKGKGKKWAPLPLKKEDWADPMFWLLLQLAQHGEQKQAELFFANWKPFLSEKQKEEFQLQVNQNKTKENLSSQEWVALVKTWNRQPSLKENLQKTDPSWVSLFIQAITHCSAEEEYSCCTSLLDDILSESLSEEQKKELEKATVSFLSQESFHTTADHFAIWMKAFFFFSSLSEREKREKCHLIVEELVKEKLHIEYTHRIVEKCEGNFSWKNLWLQSVWQQLPDEDFFAFLPSLTSVLEALPAQNENGQHWLSTIVLYLPDSVFTKQEKNLLESFISLPFWTKEARISAYEYLFRKNPSKNHSFLLFKVFSLIKNMSLQGWEACLQQLLPTKDGKILTEAGEQFHSTLQTALSTQIPIEEWSHHLTTLLSLAQELKPSYLASLCTFKEKLQGCETQNPGFFAPFFNLTQENIDWFVSNPQEGSWIECMLTCSCNESLQSAQEGLRSIYVQNAFLHEGSSVRQEATRFFPGIKDANKRLNCLRNYLPKEIANEKNRAWALSQFLEIPISSTEPNENMPSHDVAITLFCWLLKDAPAEDLPSLLDWFQKKQTTTPFDSLSAMQQKLLFDSFIPRETLSLVYLDLMQELLLYMPNPDADMEQYLQKGPLLRFFKSMYSICESLSNDLTEEKKQKILTNFIRFFLLLDDKYDSSEPLDLARKFFSLMTKRCTNENRKKEISASPTIKYCQEMLNEKNLVGLFQTTPQSAKILYELVFLLANILIENEKYPLEERLSLVQQSFESIVALCQTVDKESQERAMILKLARGFMFNIPIKIYGEEKHKKDFQKFMNALRKLNVFSVYTDVSKSFILFFGNDLEVEEYLGQENRADRQACFFQLFYIVSNNFSPVYFYRILYLIKNKLHSFFIEDQQKSFEQWVMSVMQQIKSTKLNLATEKGNSEQSFLEIFLKEIGENLTNQIVPEETRECFWRTVAESAFSIVLNLEDPKDGENDLRVIFSLYLEHGFFHWVEPVKANDNNTLNMEEIAHSWLDWTESLLSRERKSSSAILLCALLKNFIEEKERVLRESVADASEESNENLENSPSNSLTKRFSQEEIENYRLLFSCFMNVAQKKKVFAKKHENKSSELEKWMVQNAIKELETQKNQPI